MSQEKRPPAANPPGAIVQRYDPRQSPASEPQVAASQAATPQATAKPAQADPSAGGTTPATSKPAAPSTKPVEIGGPSGPEPTRYGDWERNGRVSDF